MTNIPNFNKGKGRLAADRYDLEAHLEGREPDVGSSYVHSFRHLASSVDIDSPGLVYGSHPNVETALENINDFISIFSGIGQGFIAIGDGYNTWHAADGSINFDPAIPSIDAALNAIFSSIYTGINVNPNYDRIKHGGVVLVKAGTYTIKNTINVPPGITIMGEGYGTKFVNITGLSIPAIGVPPQYRATFAVNDASIGSPIQIQTTVPHDIVTGETLVVSGVGGITEANGTFVVTVTGVDTFTLDGSTGTGGFTSGGVVTFARPMFNILPNLVSSINDRAINDFAVDSTSLFMFSRSTKFTNLVIADNFVEETISGEVYYKLPQNRNVNAPLILQSVGSNLELSNIYMIGRVQLDPGYTVVLLSDSHAIKLDVTEAITTGTILKITDCFIDGFSVPILFPSIGGTNDYLEIHNNKIRAHGYLNGDDAYATGANANNCIINMNDNNATITSNYFYSNHDKLNAIVFVDAVLGSAPPLQGVSKILIASNDFATDKTWAAAITTVKPFVLNAGITTTILTRASILTYGNTFQNTYGFRVSDTTSEFIKASSSAIELITTTSATITSPDINLVGATTVDIGAPDINLTGATTVDIGAPDINLVGLYTIDVFAPDITIISSGLITLGSQTAGSTDGISLNTKSDGGIITLSGGLITSNIVNVISTPYTCDNSDYILLIKLLTIGNDAQIILPEPSLGRRIIIKETQGDTGTYNIILDPRCVLYESYPDTNINNTQGLYNGMPGITFIGQSFLGNGKSVYKVQFTVSKTGSPSGTMEARIYAHSGTYGTSGIITGAPLAVSSTINVSVLTGSPAIIDFIFSGINLVDGTPYIIGIHSVAGSAGNTIDIGSDNSAPTHSGNMAYHHTIGGNLYTSTDDISFYLYTSDRIDGLSGLATVYAPYGSYNLVADDTDWWIL